MKKQQLIIMGVVVAAVLIIAFVLRGSKSKLYQEEKRSDPGTIEVALGAQRNAGITVVETSDRNLQEVISTTGIITPDEARVAHIAPLAQGVVKDVSVQLGARVAKGQELLVYDNVELGELIGDYQRLTSEAQKALAQEQVAKRSLERAKALIKVEAISQREFDLRQAEYEQAAFAFLYLSITIRLIS